MTDKLKIMTDNEIIKAFKDFLIEQVDGYTDHIETGGERYGFIEKELELLKETDNLINRLQAENERLTAERDVMHQDVIAAEEYAWQCKTAKAEAYKEFAERLKNEIIGDTAYGCDTNQHTGYYDYQIKIGDIPEYIDNLLKELVGDE